MMAVATLAPFHTPLLPSLMNHHSTMMATMHLKRPLEGRDQDEGPLTKKPRYHSKKRVHFSHYNNELPRVQVHTVPLVDDADMADVWYSAQDLQHFRSCDARWVRCYHSYCDTYKHQLFRVLGTACGKQSHSSEMNAIVADSPIRGLEREMSPCFRLRKKQVVTNVLQSQAALLAWQNDKQTNQGEQVLALHYHKLALPATRFAQLLAEGDAQVVATMTA
jgi:hypothetical protein